MGWHQLYVRIQLEEQPIGKQAVDAVLIESEQPTIKGMLQRVQTKINYLNKRIYQYDIKLK